MKLSRSHFRWRRCGCALWIAPGIVVSQGMGFAADLTSTCPVAGTDRPSGLPVSALRASERLIAMRRDGLLGSAWGIVMDCQHPEWPARMVALAGHADLPAPVAVVTPGRPPLAIVRAGERVSLWRQDAAARIETSGVAEESAAPGQRIRVRLYRVGLNGEAVKEFVIGIVRGARSVEILQ